MTLKTRCLAELIGTLWLVLGGCGSAVLAASFPSGDATNPVGIGFLGVALAFGLTVMTMAYAIGHISGCHLNPAVSFGLWACKRFPGSELLPYIFAQVIGASIGALIVLVIASGSVSGIDLSSANALASNGFGEAGSPGGYSLLAGAVSEIVLTFFFLVAILGATDRRAPVALAPAAIGMMLTLIHLISIPVTNTSVNPARSFGPALMVAFSGNLVPLSQLWLFWVAPIAGAIVAGFLYLQMFEASSSDTPIEDTPVEDTLVEE
ncbi:MIP family channel protein [Rubidibacter lacunae KORDI 51-2]|uniref:MIP family channel protein n=1 Tax=Rubidibacter lacunae KORDI 51-2 TaxID=582515 RepID=U5DM56_9CHRO|nr:aquaporin Z [Rubidibacter lacunae]ERN40800.1 MIP family channel protein [Rubidibacter lacunae KORDI 51-2]